MSLLDANVLSEHIFLQLFCVLSSTDCSLVGLPFNMLPMIAKTGNLSTVFNKEKYKTKVSDCYRVGDRLIQERFHCIMYN